MNSNEQIGNDVFQRMIENSGEHAEINREVWTPTPYMVDVLITEREHEIRNWLNLNFGFERNPWRESKGLWHQSRVIMHGYCWYGFETEELMNRFVKQFPSPPK
jgi:hypothetical protein